MSSIIPVPHDVGRRNQIIISTFLGSKSIFVLYILGNLGKIPKNYKKSFKNIFIMLERIKTNFENFYIFFSIGEFDNAGAMMSVDETLMCSFQILKPADKRKFQYNMNAGRPVTPPRGATNKNKKKWMKSSSITMIMMNLFYKFRISQNYYVNVSFHFKYWYLEFFR